MKNTYLFLADGFEEVEALTVVDLLRRANISCTMISISGNHTVSGSHNIQVTADALFDETDFGSADMLILPGGMPGTKHLAAHEGLKTLLQTKAKTDCCLAAICAAPSVLGGNGLLNGLHATCYPGFEDKLTGAILSSSAVVHDGKVITSRGLGTAIDFALKLIELLEDKAASELISSSIQYH